MVVGVFNYGNRKNRVQKKNMESQGYSNCFLENKGIWNSNNDGVKRGNDGVKRSNDGLVYYMKVMV